MQKHLQKEFKKKSIEPIWYERGIIHASQVHICYRMEKKTTVSNSIML